MKERYCKRVFLNPADSSDTGLYQCFLGRDGDASFDIWDCNKKISLNFSVYCKERKKQSLKKLARLIDGLMEFQSKLEVFDAPKERDYL